MKASGSKPRRRAYGLGVAAGLLLLSVVPVVAWAQVGRDDAVEVVADVDEAPVAPADEAAKVEVEPVKVEVGADQAQVAAEVDSPQLPIPMQTTPTPTASGSPAATETPAASPSPSPPASPRPEPTESPRQRENPNRNRARDVIAAAGIDNAGGGGLPVTGTEIVDLTVAGALLVVTGILVLRIAALRAARIGAYAGSRRTAFRT